MKNTLLTLSILIGGCNLVNGQIPVWEPKWDQKAGGTEDDIIGTFLATPDSGLVLCGTSFSGVSGDKTQPNYDTSYATSDFWLVKTDSNGTLQWDKRFGGNSTELLTETILTADGGYLSGGQSFSDISGDKTEPNWDPSLQSNDYWIIKTDVSGNVVWDKRYGGTSYELFGGVRQTADGGYILTGSSFSGADGDKTELSRGGWDYWLVRIDASGNIVWEKRFGGFGDDFSNSVVLTLDGKFLVAGYSNSGTGGDKTEPARGSTDYWMVKVDDTGSKIWDKTFGGDLNDWLFALCAAADGGFILGGQSFSTATGDKSSPNHEPGPSGSDRWLVKTDASGNKQWDRTIGGMSTDDLGRIVPTNDGGYLLSGESYSGISGDKTESNLGPEQTWVVKIDSAGLIQWDKTIQTYGHDESGSAIPWGDHCFITVNFTLADTGGFKTETTWGKGDYWMVKMCDETVLSNAEITSHRGTWITYPNPVSNELMLQTESPFFDVTIQLFDASGKLISQFNHLTGTGGNAVQIDLTNYPSGIYVCRIIEAEKVSNLRIIKTN